MATRRVSHKPMPVGLRSENASVGSNGLDARRSTVMASTKVTMAPANSPAFASAPGAMAVAPGALAKAGLFAGAIVTLVLAMTVDRRASRPLLPTDAFSLRSPTGIGLWLTLLVAIAYSPQIGRA